MATKTDLAVNMPYTVDSVGKTINPNTLQVGQQFKLRLGIMLMDFFHGIPGGGSTLKLDLGEGLSVSDDFSSAYPDIFTWVKSGTSVEGFQREPLPKDWHGTIEFSVVAKEPSLDLLVQAEWKVTDPEILEDFQPANNWSNMYYTILNDSTTSTTTVQEEEQTPKEVAVEAVDTLEDLKVLTPRELKIVRKRVEKRKVW